MVKTNGTFKWIAGILAVLLVSVTGSFAGFHINEDLRQSKRISKNEKDIGCVQTEIKGINEKLDLILKKLP